MNRLLLLAAAALLAVLTACTPPSTATDTRPPVISAFGAVTPTGPAPITTALTWTISDPAGRAMTCSLDLNGDGTFDQTVTNCTSASLRTATFKAVGVTSVALRVSDSVAWTTATTAVTISGASSDTFGITFRLAPSVPAAAASVFTAAAARWQAVIKTGLPSAALDLTAGQCDPNSAALHTTVDDVYIDADVVPIDGPQSVLAQAAPCSFRADGSTVYGFMDIDSADLASLEATPRYFLDVVTHEMGHVLGLGTSQRWSDLTNDANPAAPTFLGKAATGAYQALGGVGSIPLATDLGHWSATRFGYALMMNPYADVNTPASIATIDVGSLADLGYGVDLAGAEPYTLPGGSVMAPPDDRAPSATLPGRV